MYNLDINVFAKNLKYYRKTRNLTMEKLGYLINKSKATISKYEKGEIIPDITTTLLICNTLNVTLSQLFPNKNIENFTNKNYNPFQTDEIYFYYYTEKNLIVSVGEITESENKIRIKFYNGIKNINKYASEFLYFYEGDMECDKTIGYINLYNIKSQGTQLEKIQISFNVLWTKKFKFAPFFILALTPNSQPVIKKGLISSSPLAKESISKYSNDLLITKSDLDRIKNDNAWILENKNYDHFFYDFT